MSILDEDNSHFVRITSGHTIVKLLRTYDYVTDVRVIPCNITGGGYSNCYECMASRYSIRSGCPICGSATSKHIGNVSGYGMRTYGCGTIINTCKCGTAYSITTPYGHTMLDNPVYGCTEDDMV